MKHFKISVQAGVTTSKVVHVSIAKNIVYELFLKAAHRHKTQGLRRWGGGLCAHTRKKKKKTQDLRKLGNIGKISKICGGRAQYPVSLPEIKL